jgi:hypothetical protein
VLLEAGIPTAWPDCTGFGSSADCSTADPDVLRVRILPNSHGKWNVTSKALGFALRAEAPEFGIYAFIFLDRVMELAQKDERTVSRVLGYVIAHEIGHLLLSRNAHAKNGLMKADWHDREINQIRQGCLHFSKDEGEAMRSSMYDRLAAASTRSFIRLAELKPTWTGGLAAPPVQ